MASQNKYCLLKQHEKNDKNDFFIDWQHTQQQQKLVQNNSCERSNTLFANINVSIIQSNRIVLLRN